MNKLTQEMEEFVKIFDQRSFYIVKYRGGQAYYALTVQDWLQGGTVTIYHLLSGKTYTTLKSALDPKSFSDLPSNYKLDAIALNPVIRRLYGGQFQHTKNDSQMSAEWDAFYKRTSSALDSFKSEFAKRPATPSQSYTPKTITNEQFVRDSSGSQRNDEPIKSYNSKTNTMSNLLNKIPGLNFSFGTLEKGLVALSLNGDLAFRTKDGGYMTLQVDENGNKKQIAVGDLKMDVPFYTLPTQTLEVDDLVLMDGKILVVQEKPSTGGIKFVDPLTGNTSSKIAQGNILNMYFYTKIVSMFNLAGGQTGGIGLGGLNPMTLMLLSGDGGIGSGDNSFVEAMVLSQVMGAGAAGGQAINPMMLMLLSKDSNGGGGLFGGNSMLPLLMMSGGAQGGANPFGNLFGAPAQIAAPAAKTVKGAAKTAVKKTAKKVAPAKRAYVKKG